jgi:glutamine amidotransferase
VAKKQVTVVRYGVANLGSIINMLQRIGVSARVVDDAKGILSAERLILPGVGAFDTGMSALHSYDMIGPICQRVAEGVPILGVCLGMQMLGTGSAEGTQPGLGLLDAHCVRFNLTGDTRLRVPHMGWGRLKQRQSSPMLNGLPLTARFYFVHSYHLLCRNPGDILATCEYGIEFTAMIQRGNIVGAQFHPEKSHRYGMALLSNFAEWDGSGPALISKDTNVGAMFGDKSINQN